VQQAISQYLSALRALIVDNLGAFAGRSEELGTPVLDAHENTIQQTMTLPPLDPRYVPCPPSPYNPASSLQAELERAASRNGSASLWWMIETNSAVNDTATCNTQTWFTWRWRHAVAGMYAKFMISVSARVALMCTLRPVERLALEATVVDLITAFMRWACDGFSTASRLWLCIPNRNRHAQIWKLFVLSALGFIYMLVRGLQLISASLH
jgi:hypothetical protein